MSHDAGQWPHEARLKKIASAWAQLMPGEAGALACEHGLEPRTTSGFCIMYCRGRATALTASDADNPGNQLIAPHRLVNVAVCMLFLSLGPQATLAYAKKRHAEVPQSLLWATACAALMPAIGLAPPLAEAALVKNPWQRQFACAAANRLQKRCGPTEITTFFNVALSSPWKATKKRCAWIAPVARWIKTRDIQWAVTSKPSDAFLIVAKTPITLHKRDRIFILLMALFCAPTAWGEQTHCPESQEDMPQPVQDAFRATPHILNPSACSLHRAISLVAP